MPLIARESPREHNGFVWIKSGPRYAAGISLRVYVGFGSLAPEPSTALGGWGPGFQTREHTSPSAPGSPCCAASSTRKSEDLGRAFEKAENQRINALLVCNDTHP